MKELIVLGAGWFTFSTSGGGIRALLHWYFHKIIKWRELQLFISVENPLTVALNSFQHLGGDYILRLNNEDAFLLGLHRLHYYKLQPQALKFHPKPTDGCTFHALACARGTHSISLLQVTVDALGPHSCTHSWSRRKQSSASLFELLRKSSSSGFGSQSATRWPSFTRIQTAQIPVRRGGGRMEGCFCPLAASLCYCLWNRYSSFPWEEAEEEGETPSRWTRWRGKNKAGWKRKKTCI